MAEYLRLFLSAVDPKDIDDVRRLFADDVRPAFQRLPGCLGIELLINVEHNAGGLVDGAALSRWDSLEAMEAALASREVEEALVRVLRLLHQEPVTRVFEITG